MTYGSKAFSKYESSARRLLMAFVVTLSAVTELTPTAAAVVATAQTTAVDDE